MGWGLRVTRTWQTNGVSQLDGESDMVAATSACQGGGGLNKGTMASASSSIWKKDALPFLVLKPDNSVSFSMSLSPLQLLLQCWSSEPVVLSVSLCAIPLRGTPGTPAALCLTQPQSLLLFTNRNYRNFFPGTGTLGWGALCGAGTPCSSKGTSTAEVSLLIFNGHTRVMVPACSMSQTLQPNSR